MIELWDTSALILAARDKTVAIMESHKPEPLPDQVKQNIAAILEKGRQPH